jgi:hypothetical protein
MYKQKNTHKHPCLSGIRTHDSSVGAGENSSCPRPLGHCDRHIINMDLKVGCLHPVAFTRSGWGFPSNSTLVWIFYLVTATCFGLMTIFRRKYIYTWEMYKYYIHMEILRLIFWGGDFFFRRTESLQRHEPLGPRNLLSNSYRGLFYRKQSGQSVKLIAHQLLPR